MLNPEYSWWLSSAITCIHPGEYEELKKSADTDVRELYEAQDQIKIARQLLLTFYLGSINQWKTLEQRNLIPDGLEFPHVLFSPFNKQCSFLYSNKEHAMVINKLFFDQCVSIGDRNTVLDVGDIFNNKPRRMTTNIVYFLGGIEEL